MSKIMYQIQLLNLASILPRIPAENLMIVPFDEELAKEREFPNPDIFLESRAVHSKFPSIKDLEIAFNSIVMAQCLIILDNFRQVNIPSMASSVKPIIIRSHILHGISSPSSFIKPWIFGPLNFSPRNLTTTMSKNFYCPISRFFEGSDISFYVTHRFVCYELVMSKMTLSTKPWNCIIEIAVYPTLFYYYTYGLVKTHYKKFALSQHSFPSLRSAMQIFVHEYPKTVPTDRLYYDIPYLVALLNNKNINSIFLKNQLCRQIYLRIIVLTDTRSSETIGGLQHPEGLIGRIELFRTCPQEVDHREGHTVDFVDVDLGILRELAQPRYSAFIWYIDDVGELGENVFGYMVGFMRNYPYNVKLAKSGWRSPEERIGDAFAKIWYDLMGNFTIRGPQTGHADCGIRDNCFQILLSFKQYTNGTMHFPYFTRDGLSPLGFVSCGRPEMSSLPFQELTAAFDRWIWFLLVVTMVTATTPMQPFFGNSSWQRPTFGRPAKSVS